MKKLLFISHCWISDGHAINQLPTNSADGVGVAVNYSFDFWAEFEMTAINDLFRGAFMQSRVWICLKL